MSASKEIFICAQGTATFDKHKYALCGDCPFLYTFKAEYYLNDVVRCDCDATLKKGQKFTMGNRCKPIK
jgi:hypothetical protein